MTAKHSLPVGATLLKSSPHFDEMSLPEALQDRHQLKPGCWAELSVHAGRVVFIDLEHGHEYPLESPASWVVAPESPHKLRVDGPVSVHIDFYTYRGAQSPTE